MFPGSHPANKAHPHHGHPVEAKVLEKVSVVDDGHIDKAQKTGVVKKESLTLMPGAQDKDILEDPTFVCDEECRKAHEDLKKLLRKPNKKPKSEGDILCSHVHGRVKWYDTRQEYGFITRADTGEEVFLHVTGIMDIRPNKILKDVGRGERVTFDIVRGKKGGKAVNLTGHRDQPVLGSPYAVDWVESLRDFSNGVDRYKPHVFAGSPVNKLWSCKHRSLIALQKAIITNKPTLNTKPSETYQTAKDNPYELRIADTSARPDIQREIREATQILNAALCQSPFDGLIEEEPSIDEEGWIHFKELTVDSLVEELAEKCSIQTEKIAPESFPYIFYIMCEGHYNMEVFKFYRGPVYWNIITREFMMDDDQPVENYEPENEDKLIFNGLKPIKIYEGGEDPFTARKLVEEVAKLDYNPGDHRFLEHIHVELRDLDGEPAMTIMFMCGS